jgi:HTH-type transcriptional regulator / antitoxin HigA
MVKEITKKEYLLANAEMEKILAIGETKGFSSLTMNQNKALQKFTKIVHAWEEANIVIPVPDTLEGLIELKMYENKVKQKELAKMLKTSDTQLSEIMHRKRKPSVAFLKALNSILGIDGNVLLRLA